jgi:hypothetical protein
MEPTRTSYSPRLLGIVWPFIAVVILLALLGCVSLYALSAVRSYVAGESLWSKGQKDAIYYLDIYADSRDEATYRKYQQAIAIPQGGHALRVALSQPEPDLQAARAGILQGGNHPDDATNIIWLYQNFQGVSYMARAIDRWTVGDEYLLKLDLIARAMHAAVLEGRATAADMAAWKEQITAINDGVTPAAIQFSDALSEGSRFLLHTLVVSNLLIALVLIALALWRTSKLLGQRDQ